jgi:hypothetical protein
MAVRDGLKIYQHELQVEGDDWVSSRYPESLPGPVYIPINSWRDQVMTYVNTSLIAQFLVGVNSSRSRETKLQHRQLVLLAIQIISSAAPFEGCFPPHH